MAGNQFDNSISSKYREFLSNLADELTKKNLTALKFLLKDSLAAGIIEKIRNGHYYFDELERNQLISRNNLSYLLKALECIGRKDLAKRVASFENDDKMGRSNNLYGENEELTNTYKSKSHPSRNPTSTVYKLTPADIKSKQRIPPGIVSKSFPVETNDVNEMPSPKINLSSSGNLSDCYSMSKDPSGVCFIINNYFYEEVKSQDGTLLKSRDGTLKDAIDLKNTFSWLNFEVSIFDDVKAKDILEIITCNTQMSIDCFVCCILSHGFYDGVYGSDGKKVTFDEMQKVLNGNSAQWLLGKPKLFFIQACQGDEEEKEALLCKDAPVSNFKAENGISLAEDADFCFSVATTPSKLAFRHNIDGSWYIQTLCHVLREHAPSMSLSNMFLKLNHIMAEKIHKTYNQSLDQVSIAKQMSSTRYNTLRMPLHFKPKGSYIEEAFRNASLNEKNK